MITSNQIPEAVWRVAMMTYHREIRRHPEQAWQLAIAAAMTTWPGMNTGPNIYGRQDAIMHLPLPEQDASDEQ